MPARDLVPGDLILLKAGSKVPADARLLEAQDLLIDESLLTGESLPVKKAAATEDRSPRPLAERRDTAFAGTSVIRGRGRAEIVATGRRAEIGKIAEQIGGPSISRAPLLIRIERFTRNIAIAVVLAVALLLVVGLARQMPAYELFMMSVGLAVSAIPEGLPVAISIALAIAMRRMAAVHVIVRNMPAVESLGSCTMIATDKTGTLTMNELTVTEIRLPDGTALICEPSGEACVVRSAGLDEPQAITRASALLTAATLPNEASLIRDEGGLSGIGDRVDVALLSVAHKLGVMREHMLEHYPLLQRIPYEPDLKYAASFHRAGEHTRIFVKGAPETLIDMADRMAAVDQVQPIDRAKLLALKEELAGEGLRVLAFAEGEISAGPDGAYGHHHLVDLVFLGFVGMQDPVRPEVPRALSDCVAAGIVVAMITGDDPKTAAVIARRAGLPVREDAVVTGRDVTLAEKSGREALDRLTRTARIYARVEPTQKLAIVLSMARNGHFVAVTGDGVNDAPALKHAHVGVAMGRKGTDVAKESADIILTDDNFASIVAGVRYGRVAYANIRKVVFMLVSTGAAEVAIFFFAMIAGLPMPLIAVQLLWLNLVTNGIQDVALAFEKAEGDELSYPPRRPGEPIFDRVMRRRILHSMLVMGGGGFLVFAWLLAQGYSLEYARNLLLLLFVLFENFQTFNSRSERHSVFRQGFGRNPLLVLAIPAAQGVHIAAMYIPVLRDTLQVAPVSLADWAGLLLIASSLLVVMELEKAWDARRSSRAGAMG
jgi:calcium-translocating P-type ATPase